MGRNRATNKVQDDRQTMGKFPIRGRVRVRIRVKLPMKQPHEHRLIII